MWQKLCHLFIIARKLRFFHFDNYSTWYSTNSCTPILLHTSIFSGSSKISKCLYYSIENYVNMGQDGVACYFWMALYIYMYIYIYICIQFFPVTTTPIIPPMFHSDPNSRHSNSPFKPPPHLGCRHFLSCPNVPFCHKKTLMLSSKLFWLLLLPPHRPRNN